MQMRPRVKICCIKSPAEAALAIACGASALGLVSAMPSGPGVISEDTIARIADTVPPPMDTVCKLESDFNKLAKTIDITMQIRSNSSLFLLTFRCFH